MATLAVTLVATVKVTEPAPTPLMPVAPVASVRRPRWRLVVGGLALGTGALLGGFGSGALVADGSCIEPSLTPLGACKQLYSTSALGAGLMAAGGALLLSGTVLLAVPGRRPATTATK